MALFGPKDAKLPRLTTFYQIEDWDGDPYTFLTSELYQWLVKEKHGSSMPPHYPVEWENLTRLRDLHRLIKTLMFDLYKRGKVSVVALQAFSALRASIPQETQVRQVLLDETGAEYDAEGAWISPNFISTGYVKKLPYDYNIGMDIAESMIETIFTPEKLLQCDECASIFVARRKQDPPQRFCSHRCQHRRLMREKTREKKTITHNN